MEENVQNEEKIENNQQSLKRVYIDVCGTAVIFGVTFATIYTVLNIFVSSRIGNLNLLAVISALLQFFVIFFMWKSSLAFALTKKTIAEADSKKLMKSIWIITLIIWFVVGISNYFYIKNSIDYSISSNKNLQTVDIIAEELYDEETIAEYQAQRDAMIDSIYAKMYTYYAIIEVGTLVTYMLAAKLQKKKILKHVS